MKRWYQPAKLWTGVIAFALLLPAMLVGPGARGAAQAGRPQDPERVRLAAPAGRSQEFDLFIVFRYNPRGRSYVVDSVHADGASASARGLDIIARGGRANVVGTYRLKD